jgi:hypothetical protein
VLDGLCRDSHRPVKILISSRPETDIRDRLSTLTNIEITAAKNDKDIEAFIRESMLDHHPWTPALEKTKGLKGEVITKPVSKSGGMFQWMSLQIDQLRKRNHEKDILQRLEELPKGLTKAYEEIYKHIEERGDYSRNQSFARSHGFLAHSNPSPLSNFWGLVVSVRTLRLAVLTKLARRQNKIFWAGVRACLCWIQAPIRLSGDLHTFLCLSISSSRRVLETCNAWWRECVW